MRSGLRAADDRQKGPHVRCDFCVLEIVSPNHDTCAAMSMSMYMSMSMSISMYTVSTATESEGRTTKIRRTSRKKRTETRKFVPKPLSQYPLQDKTHFLYMPWPMTLG